MPGRSRSASFATASEGSRAKPSSARISATPAADEMDLDVDIDEVEGFLDDLPDGEEQAEEEDGLEIADSQPARKVFDHVFIGAPRRKFNRDAYKVIESENTVVKVLEEDEEGVELSYLVRFGDMRHEKVSRSSLLLQRGHSHAARGIT